MELTTRSLTKQTSIYGFFHLAQRAASFAVIPIYTHYLTPGEFGSLDILYLIVWFIGIVGGSKLDAAFLRYYAAAKDSGEADKLLGSSITALVLFATGFCSLAAIFGRPILEFMYSSKSLPFTGFYLALAGTWLELVGSLPLAYLRINQQAKLVGSISLFHSLAGTIAGVAFVTYLGMRFEGILLGVVISGVVLVVTAYAALLRSTSIPFNLSYCRTLYRYALPMLPAPLFMYVLNYADRYFLLKYWSLEEVGIYAMAYKFAMLLNLAIMYPFGEMWGANQFVLFETKQKKTYQKLALLYVSVMYLAALGISYFSYEVTIIAFDKKFHVLLSVVAPLTVGIAIWGLVPTLDFGCQIRDKTWIRSVTTGIAALINVILNCLLIPSFGIMGAALATLFSFILLATLTYAFNKALTDYCLDIRKAITLSLLLLTLSMIAYARPYLSYIAFTVIRITALGFFVYVILRANQITWKDLLISQRWAALRK